MTSLKNYHIINTVIKHSLYIKFYIKLINVLSDEKGMIK